MWKGRLSKNYASKGKISVLHFTRKYLAGQVSLDTAIIHVGFHRTSVVFQHLKNRGEIREKPKASQLQHMLEHARRERKCDSTLPLKQYLGQVGYRSRELPLAKGDSAPFPATSKMPWEEVERITARCDLYERWFNENEQRELEKKEKIRQAEADREVNGIFDNLRAHIAATLPLSSDDEEDSSDDDELDDFMSAFGPSKLQLRGFRQPRR